MAVTITIITIVRNNANILSATLDSVRYQSVLPCEHIIIDGESTDDSLKICQRYAEQVSYPVKIISRAPTGVYDAINHGIHFACGDITALLHGGDIYASPDIFKQVQEMFENTPQATIMYGDIAYMSKRGEITGTYSGKHFTPNALKWGFMFPHPSMFTRTTLYHRYGLYATNYKIAGDYEWLVRVILKAAETTVYLNKCVVHMSKGGVSTQLGNRLFVTPAEKLRALRSNGIKVCPLRMIGRYIYALK